MWKAAGMAQYLTFMPFISDRADNGVRISCPVGVTTVESRCRVATRQILPPLPWWRADKLVFGTR